MRLTTLQMFYGAALASTLALLFAGWTTEDPPGKEMWVAGLLAAMMLLVVAVAVAVRAVWRRSR